MLLDMPVFWCRAMRGMSRLCACACFALLFTGCAAPSPISKIQPFVGTGSQAQYRHVSLSNGLEVLLVSRSDTDRAAASLSVSVGSADDPKGREGMAHFLEHMLFLGTDQFPDVGEYQKFLSAHGGTFNAYTALEETNYFFSVLGEHFEPALARFSRFFVAPLIDAGYTQREREAVDAEFYAGKTHDSRRLFDVLKAHMNPDHPLSKFHVGNLHTLDGPDLHSAVRTFYQLHYGAANMKLCLVGNQSLETLHVLAKRYFQDVDSFGGSRPDIPQPLFTQEQLATSVHFSPKRDQRSLLLVFDVPNTKTDYLTKPLQYVAHLLGHEGQGSLFSLLKQRGWAEALLAGHGLDYRGGATFDTNILLTPKGMRHVDDIVALVFDTLELIRSEGVNAWRYEEIARMGRLNFRYRELGDSLSYAVAMSARMWDYPVRDILRGPYFYDNFDAALIQDRLSYLRPDNMIMVLGEPGSQHKSKTTWYEVPYSSEKVSANTLKRWSQAGLNPELSLPTVNHFIPENTKVYPQLRQPKARMVPSLVEETSRLQVWHLQNQRFALPYADTIMRMDFVDYRNTTKHKALAKLWVALLQDMLNEEIYTAYLAGIRVSVQATLLGIELRITGYHDKQEKILERIVNRILHFEPDPERVHAIRTELMRNLRNTTQDTPYQVLHARLGQLLVDGGVTEIALAKALEKVGVEDLRLYARALPDKLHIQAFVQGNVLPEDARRLRTQLRRIVAHKPVATLDRAIVLLPSDVVNIWGERLPHTDTGFVFALQAEDDTVRTRAMVELSQRIMRADFFRELRTERQLGYVVYMSQFNMLDLTGLSWTVQSPDSTAKSLEKEIRDFMRRSVNYAERLSTSEFDRHLASFVESLQEEPKTLAAATDLWWGDIIRARYGFDYREKLIATVNAITRDQWADFYTAWLNSTQKRELLLYATAEKHALNDTSAHGYRREHNDIEGFRNQSGANVLIRQAW